jgi:hypothetical protein
MVPEARYISENGGEKVDHGSGEVGPLRVARWSSTFALSSVGGTLVKAKAAVGAMPILRPAGCREDDRSTQ